MVKHNDQSSAQRAADRDCRSNGYWQVASKSKVYILKRIELTTVDS